MSSILLTRIIMFISQIIFLISIIIWIFPSIRQRSNEYFYFFIILTFAGPMAFLFYNFFGIYELTVVSFLILLQFFSLQITKEKRNSKIINIIVVTMYFILIISFDWPNYCLIVMYMLVLGKLLHNLTLSYFKKNTLSIFEVVLVFFLISEVVNNIVVLTATKDVMILFFLTFVFQFLIAIFFSIFREDSPRLQIKLKTVEDELGNEFNSPNV